MEVTKIQIKKLIPGDEHVGFASCVIDDWLYLGNIAIFNRRDSSNIRLVFPEKKVGSQKISMFHPLTQEAYFNLEKIIFDKLNKLAEEQKQYLLNT